MNKTIKKLISSVLVIIGLTILSFLMGTVISVFVQDPTDTKITFDIIIKNITDKKSITLSVIFLIGFLGMVIYYTVKLGYFGHTRMINRNDRASSGKHGNARFQTPEEMAQNFGQKDGKSYHAYNWNELGTSDFNGIICHSFKKNGKLYIEGVKESHSLIVGGTGAGKTTGCMSPTIQANALSSKKSSMLIYDLKGDLYKIHSKMLEDNGYKVLILNLKEPVKSIKFNPLALIWDLYQDYLKAKATNNIEEETALDTKISNYITDIALKIVPTATGENKVWSEGSQGIIKGLLWGMLEDSTIPGYNITKEKFTLSQLGNILNIPSQREELFNFLQDRPKNSEVFKKSGLILGNESEKTVSSYISNTQSNLEKFTEKGIELVTSESDFDMREIVEQPTAIFIAIDDTNPACHILCSLLTSQVRNYLVLYADTHGNKLDRTWYFLLDEFANLPKIENFNKWMSTDRGRMLFYQIFVQSPSQLENIFNKQESTEIINNCMLQVYMKAGELDTLKYFYQLFGTYTGYSRSHNVNEKSLDSGIYEGSKSLDERHLVNMDDLQYIERGNIYFIYTGLPPCKATLIPFYDSELNANGTFRKGCIEINRLNTYPDFDTCFYDLSIRRETYLNDGVPLTNSDQSTPEENNSIAFGSKNIVDATDEYEAVDTHNIRTVNYEELASVLGWDTESAEANEIKIESAEQKQTKEVHTSIDKKYKVEEIKQLEEASDNDFLAMMKKRKSKKRRDEEDEE